MDTFKDQSSKGSDGNNDDINFANFWQHKEYYLFIYFHYLGSANFVYSTNIKLPSNGKLWVLKQTWMYYYEFAFATGGLYKIRFLVKCL